MMAQGNKPKAEQRRENVAATDDEVFAKIKVTEQ